MLCFYIFAYSSPFPYTCIYVGVYYLCVFHDIRKHGTEMRAHDLRIKRVCALSSREGLGPEEGAEGHSNFFGVCHAGFQK